MKKFIFSLVILPLLFVAGVVFAESPVYKSFIDQDEIPDWAQAAAGDMNDKGILTGYQDGSFGPNDYVTRAQLAAVVDRFEDLVIDISERKSLDLVYAMEHLDYVDLGEEGDRVYHLAVLMAEAGMRRSNMSLSGVKGLSEEFNDGVAGSLVDAPGLPDGYSVYNGGLYSFYVVYDGMKNFGQDGWEVTEVYGPFSSYDGSNRYNSATFY